MEHSLSLMSVTPVLYMCYVVHAHVCIYMGTDAVFSGGHMPCTFTTLFSRQGLSWNLEPGPRPVSLHTPDPTALRL